ncbi:DUF3472 domain-containing protein [Maribellus maritimus]|uniref:DUF3472 domain-containing protein n=1 Tax=Maribellus maritimus TaxID=2870838 RepID=UPI001EEC00B1|nr:DUF3472 domain-containing protein [Maribellus maritimus]MCG6185955.1 DUF3472 domain-containing protein [Maribellus maritimus]
MKIVRNIICVAVLIVFSVMTSSCQKQSNFLSEDWAFACSIPLEGNCWLTNTTQNNPKINEGGLNNWTDSNAQAQIYFKTEYNGELQLALLAKAVSGPSELVIKLEGQTKNCLIENTDLDTVYVGSFTVGEAGYHQVDIRGLKKEGEYFAEVKSLLIGGQAAEGKVYFAKDDFYWARRGPSVHLNFEIPEDAGDLEYFYNEITVPENNDVQGSYFMADGFAQGYFGMQVNSSTERRILFSVWSPFKTDNPGEIPDEYKISLLKKGDGVHTGEFGNEGSGGQSYLVFPWKAGTTYKFLLKGKPSEKGMTDFTAWFFAPEVGEWKLIASFRRPKTDTYLTHLYSFLENFKTETGNITRMAKYSNQWVYTRTGNWKELSKIKFTADATARKESRMDYAGGVEGNDFFLKNCGFFNKTTPIDTFFEREKNNNPPQINFEELP